MYMCSASPLKSNTNSARPSPILASSIFSSAEGLQTCSLSLKHMVAFFHTLLPDRLPLLGTNLPLLFRLYGLHLSVAQTDVGNVAGDQIDACVHPSFHAGETENCRRQRLMLAELVAIGFTSISTVGPAMKIRSHSVYDMKCMGLYTTACI